MEYTVYQSQYAAALEMLREVVRRCPPEMWDDPAPKNHFWRVAYHAIFYTHLYVHPQFEDFAAWPKHRAEAEALGMIQWPTPHPAPDMLPYTPEEVLEFADFCQEQAINFLPKLDLDGPSGFHWWAFSKRELQIYNLRHLQQHTGELADRLGAQGIEVPWYGSR